MIPDDCDQEELETAPPIVFILLNPSTADEVRDDPTVARCRRFAARWGFSEVIVLNAFAFRSTDPSALRKVNDPVGPENDRVIKEAIDWISHRKGGELVCGWGNHGAYLNRSRALRSLLEPYPALAFPLTKSGEPGHPLYLPNSVKKVSLQAPDKAHNRQLLC